jgi:hypothetical protein
MPSVGNADEAVVYIDDIYFSNNPYVPGANIAVQAAGGTLLLDASNFNALDGNMAFGYNEADAILDIRNNFSATWMVNVTTPGYFIPRPEYVSPNTGGGDFIVTVNGTTQYCAYDDLWGYKRNDARDKYALVKLEAGIYPITVTLRNTNQNSTSAYMNLHNIEFQPYVPAENITEIDGVINAPANKTFREKGIDLSSTAPNSLGSWTNGNRYAYWSVIPSEAGAFNVMADYSSDWAEVNQLTINGASTNGFAKTTGWDDYKQAFMGVFSLIDDAQILKVGRTPEAVNLRNLVYIRQGVTQTATDITLPVERASLAADAELTAATQSSDYALNWTDASVSFDVDFTDAGYYIVSSPQYTGSDLVFSVGGTAANKVNVSSTGKQTVTVSRTGTDPVTVNDFVLTYSGPTSISDASRSDANLISEKYYTVQGIEITKPAFGIYVVKRTYDNGIVKVDKVSIK